MTKLRWQSGFMQRQALVPELLRPRLCVFPPQKMHGGLVTAAPTRFRRKDKIEQRIQKMFPALLQIARPHDQSALRVRGRYREFLGALIPPVQAMDKRSCHLRIEFKIKVAHGWISVLLQ